MKNLAKTLILAGSLAIFSGCGNDSKEEIPKKEIIGTMSKEVPKKESKVYNEVAKKKSKDLQIYNKVFELAKNEGEGEEELKVLIFTRGNKKYSIFAFTETKSLDINIYEGKTKEHFADGRCNGINNKIGDHYSLKKDKKEIVNFSDLNDKQIQKISDRYDSLITILPELYFDSLKVYGRENKSVYGDFAKFIKSKTKLEYGSWVLHNHPFEQDKYFLRISNDNRMRVASNFMNELGNNSIAFSDKNCDGLNSYGNIEVYGEGEKPINSFPENKRLEFAQEYTRILKGIMHNAKYKAY